MKTLIVLALAGGCGAVAAQTPANNPMPDGSRDLYLGLGVVSAPAYQGAMARRVAALPLLQFEWSNGVFVSGLSAGMHLSSRPVREYGPLLTLHMARTRDGTRRGADGVIHTGPGLAGGMGVKAAVQPDALQGMDQIGARLQVGGFANFYLTPTVRLTNSVLYGAGKKRDALAWNVGLQHTQTELTPHHRLSLGAGMTLVSRSHNASYFGVSEAESVTSGYRTYAPGGGVRDVYLGAGWNWALSPGWMLASSARVVRLQGDARHSPLVKRPTSISISTGLAYRF